MDGCRVGVGRAEIELTKPGPICGWGPGSTARAKPPEDPDQRLFVTAIALEDASAERVVLVNADLHCGGVHLWRAAAAVADLDESRVVVCGSHNHAGPGQRYGGRWYTFATASQFGIMSRTRRLAKPIQAAVREAIATLAPGGVGVGRAVVRDAGSNRALPAWSHYDDDERAAFFAHGPGAALRDEPHEADRTRDPRVTTLVATDDEGSIRGVLAWYSIHANSLGKHWEWFGSDLYGYARAEAETSLGVAKVGFGGASSADISPRPIDPSGTVREGEIGGARPDRCEAIGRRIGRAVGSLAPTITPTPFSLATAHEVWSPRTDGLPAPVMGMAMAGGGPDGPSTPKLLDTVGDGVRATRYLERKARWAFPPGHGQAPKLNILATFIAFPIRLKLLFRFLMPKEVPLHVVRIGEHAFATVPGEPTTMAGWRIEQRVHAAAGTTSASVIGFAGDYAGYWVTPEEYLEQRYEAASTIWGRDATSMLTDRLVTLANAVSAYDAAPTDQHRG